MIELENLTPFKAHGTLLADGVGATELHVFLKASFQYTSALQLASEQDELLLEDEYYGEPESSSLKDCADVQPVKPASDILVSGHACALNNQACYQMDVAVLVGSVNKQLRVVGNRQWSSGLATQAESFVRMPVIYERAFSDRSGKRVASNPVGSNYSAKDHEGKALPNIELAEAMIQSPADTPAPAGFAPLAPIWPARAQHAGSYDEHWAQNRAPYLPEDFNPAFYNCASPGLIYPGYLSGGELVRVLGMHADGEWRFNLPSVSPQLQLPELRQTAALHCETLRLFPNERRFSMCWHAVIAQPQKQQKVLKARISLAGAAGESAC
ncbi:DUF2169 family type VI secretion system accessory protein [Agaribacterium haliotis]|uniref:DUF2169 family type VI secretion system accessory protein n=1 Tax=Agaribacterium haliotis TaxID=2013869 RepID=UPI000BB58DD9|nr:DUF2169 domain-containing protein [Agaribacterium haliotis]